MNFPDVRTVLFGQLITDILCTLVLTSLWLQNRRRYAGLSFWVATFILQMTAALLLVLRGGIPDWLPVGLFNPLMIAGAFVSYWGLVRFVEKRSPMLPNLLLLGGFILAHFYFVFARPDVNARNLNVSLGMLAACGQSAWLMLRRAGGRQRNITRVVGGVYTLICLTSLVRIAITLVMPQANNDFFRLDLYDTLILMAYQVLFVSLTFSLALMVNRRLLVEVKAQEEKFTSAFHSSPYAIVITRSADGVIVDVNRGFEEVSGYPAAEVVGKDTRDLALWVNEADRDRVYSDLSAGKAVRGREFQFRTKSGRQITGIYSAEFFTAGNDRLIVSNISDISERKQVEEITKASEERYRSLFENILNGFAYCQMIYEDGRPQNFIYLDVNRAFETLTGLQNVVGKRVSEVIPGIREADPELFEIYGRVAQTGRPEVFETYVISLRMWFSVSVYCPQKGFFVAVFDVITERKQAEEKIRKEQARLHMALEAAGGGIWEWDLATNENLWSEELWKVYGLEPHSCQPSYEAWAQLVHPDDREKTIRAVTRAAAEGAQLSVEWRVCDPDGSERWLISRGRPILNAAGQVERYIGAVLDITEQKRAEAELRLHKTILEETGRIAQVGGWAFDPITGEGYWTDEVAHIHDLDPAVGISRDVGIQFYTEGSRPIIAAAVKNVVEKGISYDLELEIVSAQGVHKWVRTIGHPEMENGRVIRVYGSLQDITDRVKMEAEAQATREILETALASMNDAVFISDSEGRFIEFNEAFATFHKFKNKNECARTLDEYPALLEVYLANGEAAPLDQWAVPRALRGEIGAGVEYGLRRKDTGETWTGSYSFAPIRDKAGAIAGSVVVARDITERKRAVEEIQRLNADLEQRVRERAAELSDLYNNAPCGYHSLDGNGTFLHINDTELSWLGYTREELVGKVRVTDLITPDKLPVFRQNFPILKERGWIKDVELNFKRKDGTILPVLVSATAIRDQDGNYQSSRTTLIDFTSLKKAEETLRLSHQKLEMVNKELEAFAYSVSHDLRAPLRGIDGWSLALEEDYRDQLDDQGRLYIHRVRSETGRMGLLIDEMLQLSRVTRAEIQIVPVDISGLAQTILARLLAGQPDRRAEVVIQPGLSAPGDEALLGILLTNLFDNALKFTGHRPSARIEFGSTRLDGEQVFFVRDNGAGFDMKYAQKLFTPFQRLHRVSEFPGTGVGLATVQRIINRHNGRVWAQAQVDQGATIFFTLEEKA